MVVFDRLMLGSVVRYIIGAVSPYYTEVILADLVLDPVETYVYKFLLVLRNIVVVDSVGGIIICCYWRRRMWVAY